MTVTTDVVTYNMNIGNALVVTYIMNMGNAYRRARYALCFEEPLFAVGVQLVFLESLKSSKNQNIRPKLYNVKILVVDSGTGFSQLVPENRSAPINCKPV